MQVLCASISAFQNQANYRTTICFSSPCLYIFFCLLSLRTIYFRFFFFFSFRRVLQQLHGTTPPLSPLPPPPHGPLCLHPVAWMAFMPRGRPDGTFFLRRKGPSLLVLTYVAKVPATQGSGRKSSGTLSPRRTLASPGGDSGRKGVLKGGGGRGAGDRGGSDADAEEGGGHDDPAESGSVQVGRVGRSMGLFVYPVTVYLYVYEGTGCELGWCALLNGILVSPLFHSLR